MSFSLSMDGCQHVLKKLLVLRVVVSGQSLDNIHGYSINVVLLKVVDVLHQGLNGFTRCEQGPNGRVDAEIGQTGAQDLVSSIKQCQTKVDK